MKLTTRFAVLASSLAFTVSVGALANFDLKQPQLAFPVGFPERERTNIMSALQRTDCKFAGGSFINSGTTLGYVGDAGALSLFLEGLIKCSGSVVSVRFLSDPPANGYDWTVHHMADRPRDFGIQVNLKSSRIKLEELSLPPMNGTPLTESKRGRDRTWF